MTKRAKTLDNQQFATVLSYVGETSSSPLRDYVIFILSYKAGLRSAEIAGLEWSDVTDAFNNIGRAVDGERFFEVPAGIAKKGHGRVVPMHPALFAALTALRNALPGHLSRGRQHVVRGAHSPSISAGALQKYVERTYAKFGLVGCSSHSGRRSFITGLTRTANAHGCSLRDVQAIAGHRYLSSTEAYIDLSSSAYNMVAGV